jgi:hypothetical protein
MCELQGHVWRVRQNQSPFSPIRILSRMQNIGNHLGYGRQEDAHEFMRWAFDHEVWRQPHQIAIIHLPQLTPLNIMRKTPWTDSRSDCEQSCSPFYHQNLMGTRLLSRFAIDSMQSTCLDGFGGENVVDPASQQTTLIHHIFGGHLQSQVCNFLCTYLCLWLRDACF